MLQADVLLVLRTSTAPTRRLAYVLEVLHGTKYTSIVIGYLGLILRLCFWVDSKHILGLIDSRNSSLWRPVDGPWRLWTYSHINVYIVCRSLGGISGSSKKSSLAAVIGGVVAGVVVLSLIASLLFCLWRRRRSTFDPKHDYFHKGRDGKVPKLSIIMWESTHTSEILQTSLYQTWSLGGWAFGWRGSMVVLGSRWARRTLGSAEGRATIHFGGPGTCNARF